MHYLYFVLLADATLNNSMEARNGAMNLLEQEGFCAEGYFGYGRADWYVIGGRWSGELDFVQRRNKLAGADPHEPYGHDSDAQKLTPQLATALARKYGAEGVEVFDEDACTEISAAELTGEKYLGRWIVVVDYHT